MYLTDNLVVEFTTKGCGLQAGYTCNLQPATLINFTYYTQSQNINLTD